MALFKKLVVKHVNDAGAVSEYKWNVNVSRDGAFTVNIHEQELLPIAGDLVSTMRTANNGLRVYGSGHSAWGLESRLYADIERVLRATVESYSTPTVTQAHVIVFNLATSVRFAEDADGRIYPNASYPNAAWAKPPKGSSYASWENATGQGFLVEAEAKTKTTHAYGAVERHTYDSYYGPDGDHFCREHPAAVLNHWTFARRGVRTQYTHEIPYTDDAATFFHELMTGVCRMVRDLTRIMEIPANLETAISAKLRLGAPLSGPKP